MQLIRFWLIAAGVSLLGLLLLASAPQRVTAGPLHDAVRVGDVAQVRKLLAQGADVNARDEDGNTPLQLAVEGDHRAVIGVLAAHANINALPPLPPPPLGTSDFSSHGNYVCGFNVEWGAVGNELIRDVRSTTLCPEVSGLSGFETSSYFSGNRRRILLKLIQADAQRADRYIAVEQPGLRNAGAMKCRTRQGEWKKLIVWDPDFMRQLDDEAGTRWASVAVLAHEIAHHVNDDTDQDPRRMSPGARKEQELYADEWAGYKLRGLGASLEEAVAVFRRMGEGGETHPPSASRVRRATKGWHDAGSSAPGTSRPRSTPRPTPPPVVMPVPLPATVCANQYTGQPVCRLGVPLARGTLCSCPGIPGVGVAL